MPSFRDSSRQPTCPVLSLARHRSSNHFTSAPPPQSAARALPNDNWPTLKRALRKCKPNLGKQRTNGRPECGNTRTDCASLGRKSRRRSKVARRGPYSWSRKSGVFRRCSSPANRALLTNRELERQLDSAKRRNQRAEGVVASAAHLLPHAL